MVVRNDRPVNPPATLRDIATIRRLHRVVQRAIDRKVPALSVRYDRRGIPRAIEIDNLKQAIDDEVAYRRRALLARYQRPLTPRFAL